jgi:UDP-GlcNAc:undecaprenyl-phosphate/decaprenyl-phosphate GlcNAc-1-phosphate transferase
MAPLLLLLVLSFALCMAITPLARLLARYGGLVDQPDGRRKMHGRPIPVSGGLAVLVSVSLAVTAVAVVPMPFRDALDAKAWSLVGLFLGSVVICAAGVADDFGHLRVRHKLLGQCLAVGVVIGFGVLVRNIHVFGWHVELGLLAVPFTAFLLLGAINSLNLLDGMDGLLGSVGVIISLALAAMAGLAGRWPEAGVASALAGALLGFLRYNFPPASIFLGDAGSMLVGLVLGTLAIESSLKTPATIVLSFPVALLALPIFDTTAAIVRRKLTGRSLYTTDRGHLHHCLLRHGLSTWQVLLLVSVCCAVTGIGVLASQAFNNELIALLTALAVICLLITTRLFGFAEAVLIKQRLLSLGVSLFRSWPGGEARQTEIRLQGSLDWAELWKTLTNRAAGLNLTQLRLDVNAPALHEGYHACWDRFTQETDGPNLWRVEIPLTTRGHAVGRLEVAGQADHEPVWAKVATVTRVVENFEALMNARADADTRVDRLVVPTLHLVPQPTPETVA